MPQVFQVLCCYNCELFQVHQVKKSNKWQCKVCNEKQSLKKAFRIGAARDCRVLVQQLNMQKAEQKFDADTEEHLKISNSHDNSFTCQTYALEDEKEVENIAKVDVSINEYQYLNHDSLEDLNDFPYTDAFSNITSENGKRSKSHVLLDRNYSDKYSVDVTAVLSVINEPTEYFKSRSEDSSYVRKCNEDNESVANINEKGHEKCKRPFANNDVSSRSVTSPPPFKKNRGFQMIVKAASKLS